MKPVTSSVYLGPLVRACTDKEYSFFFAAKPNLKISMKFYHKETPVSTVIKLQRISLGKEIALYLFRCQPESAINGRIHYDVCINNQCINNELGIVPDNQSRPSFVTLSSAKHIAHGSCRKPHAQGADALATLSELIDSDIDQCDLLIHSGDQIYADDVSGPMMRAIHQLINQLGFYEETLEHEEYKTSADLYGQPQSLYTRDALLPTKQDEALTAFFSSGKKPIFTSHSAKNHLVTRAEFYAMYLLVWSPTPWQLVNLDRPQDISDKDAERYDRELKEINAFVQSLGTVRRLLANCPNYMIFDDHDISDDWNLNRQWEENAYGHPFSRQIIANGLNAYALFQGWGNQPERIEQDFLTDFLSEDTTSSDTLSNKLLSYSHWHFELDTQPKIFILDTRTNRWRSESKPSKPSGLIDWEHLCELQQKLFDEKQAIIVSPAPMFGVKLIETIQRIFSSLGQALTVDAENWMAHRGSANVLLNMFKHNRTCERFLILSGDVHYSFVFDVRMRFHRHSDVHITQFTASGFKNQFPSKLLNLLDRLDRVLFHPRSPLNFLTKRGFMKITARKTPNEERLVVEHAVGLVDLNNLESNKILTSNGEIVDFIERTQDNLAP